MLRLEAEHDPGQLESLHTCARGSGPAPGRRQRVGPPKAQSWGRWGRLGQQPAWDPPGPLRPPLSPAQEPKPPRSQRSRRSQQVVGDLAVWQTVQQSSSSHRYYHRPPEARPQPRDARSCRDELLPFSSPSVLRPAGSRGAGRASWREIQQVCKPAWQAEKMLPGFCPSCRECHTLPS